MDSLEKIKARVIKVFASDIFDNDIKINIVASDMKYWCETYLRILENIEETSISPAHKIERKEKLLDDILD